MSFLLRPSARILTGYCLINALVKSEFSPRTRAGVGYALAKGLLAAPRPLDLFLSSYERDQVPIKTSPT